MAQPTTQVRNTEGRTKGNNPPARSPDIVQRKLNPLFVDDVSNISIAPNGACRLHFTTWSTGDDNKPLQVQSEVIMTIQSLKVLAEALPKAIEQAECVGQEMSE